MRTALLLSLACLPCVAIGQTVTASWDPNPEPHVGGYRVLHGTNSAQYPFTNTVVGRLSTNFTISVTAVQIGVTYWVVQAFSTNGLSSANSYEVLWTNTPVVVPPIPPSAPRGFKLSASLQSGGSPTGPWTNLADMLVPVPFLTENKFFRTKLLLEELPKE